MGMNQPQAFKPGGCRAESVKIGNQNALVIPEDNYADLTLAVDEQADLPVERAGKKGYFSCQIVADYSLRRDAPAVETFQRLDLLGAQSRCVTQYFIDGAPSLVK